jgi:hypothetical protein
MHIACAGDLEALTSRFLNNRLQMQRDAKIKGPMRF